MENEQLEEIRRLQREKDKIKVALKNGRFYTGYFLYKTLDYPDPLIKFQELQGFTVFFPLSEISEIIEIQKKGGKFKK